MHMASVYIIVFRFYTRTYIILGLHLEKNVRFMLFTIKTSHNFCVDRYLESKRYTSFAFIVIYNSVNTY